MKKERGGGGWWASNGKRDRLVPLVVEVAEGVIDLAAQHAMSARTSCSNFVHSIVDLSGA
eukprot:1056159-Rhodomonas_salina.1